MSADRLARMANNIASFFESYPREEAVTGIHDHIRAFWTPVMRSTLRERLAEDAGGLNPLVVEAMTRQPRAPNPTEKEAAGPDEVGQIGASDAG